MGCFGRGPVWRIGSPTEISVSNNSLNCSFSRPFLFSLLFLILNVLKQTFMSTSFWWIISILFLVFLPLILAFEVFHDWHHRRCLMPPYHIQFELTKVERTVLGNHTLDYIWVGSIFHFILYFLQLKDCMYSCQTHSGTDFSVPFIFSFIS